MGRVELDLSIYNYVLSVNEVRSLGLSVQTSISAE